MRLIYIAFTPIINPMTKPGPLLLLALLVLLASAAEKESINLSFFVEHEVELDRDYLEMVVEIKADDSSLKNALEYAAQTVAFVRN